MNCYLFFSIFCLVSAEISGERNVLLRLYQQTDGPAWLNSTNWNTSVDICTWFGIECNVDGYVEQISLSNNNLEGEIPVMSGLQQLYAFSADGNRLSGDLSVFDNIKTFQAITIKHNRFSGIANMIGTTMKWFHADNNSFTDITYLVKNCPELEVLGLTHNSITTIPRNLASLSQLTTLSLGCNKLSSTIPTEFSGLINLASVDLSNNRLSGFIPESLGSLPSLTEILLQNNLLSGSIPASFFNSKSLVLMDLSNNLISGSLDLFESSTSIMSAYLQGTSIFGQVPSLMYSSVRHLDVRKTNVDCPILDYNREIVVSDCPEKVMIEVHGMSKCPDFKSFAKNVALPLLQDVGEIVKFKVGWIMTASTSYSTGYSSMHGDTEVIGDFLFSCAFELYNASHAFQYYDCMTDDIDSLPITSKTCCQKFGLDYEVISKCAFGKYGESIIEEAVQLPIEKGSVWCPTVYINDDFYCKYDSFPCYANSPSDYITTVCSAYQGTNKPKACEQ
ncbi:Polygalacturonase inhibitor 1 [Entamoeba marina]